MKTQIEKSEKEKKDLAIENERNIRTQGNQLEYREEQLESLQRTIAELKKELKQERQAHKASVHAVEEIKKMIGVSPMRAPKRKESYQKDEVDKECRCITLDGVLKENQDLKRNIDILNARMESTVDEFYIQRNDLEKRVADIERHYREKQLQDEFSIATLKSIEIF